jgi:Psq-like protein/Tc5 transposase-like DNA-binding protein
VGHHHHVGHFCQFPSSTSSTRFFSTTTTTMPTYTKEARIILAIAAIQSDPKLSIRKAASIYNVSRTSLKRRIDGVLPKVGSHDTNAKLTIEEAEVIIQYILDLDARGFSPTKAEVEDMANLLLAKRDAPPVGKCWTDRFISQQPRISTRLNRAYDYQRALQEDPAVLNAWFKLASNMRATYGVPDCDFYKLQ